MRTAGPSESFRVLLFWCLRNCLPTLESLFAHLLCRHANLFIYLLLVHLTTRIYNSQFSFYIANCFNYIFLGDITLSLHSLVTCRRAYLLFAYLF